MTNIDAPSLEEGDCRYMPKEILAEDASHLTKADVFSLGCTMHELASCNELPNNGAAWHQLRDGSPPALPRYSRELNDLINIMLHPDPKMRPSAHQILNHPAVVTERKVPGLQKSKQQLYDELRAEKMEKRLVYQELNALKKRDPNVLRTGGAPRSGLGLGPKLRRNSAPAMRYRSTAW